MSNQFSALTGLSGTQSFSVMEITSRSCYGNMKNLSEPKARSCLNKDSSLKKRRKTGIGIALAASSISKVSA